MAGSTQSIAMLASGLAQRGHHIWVGCRKESMLFEMLGNSGVTRIPMIFKGKLDLANAREIARWVKQEKIQIINAQSSYDRYTSIWAKWLYGSKAKVVHTRRQKPMSSGGFLQNQLYNKGADAIVAVSGGVAEALQQLGIRAEKISIIKNGTPVDKYTSMDPALTERWRKKLDLEAGRFTIGCVARRKNQEDLLLALALLDFPTQVIFAGISREDVDQEILKSVNEGQHRLHFMGELAQRDLLHLYPLMDVKVLPSLMEGLSQSLLEAMALGIPVIATHASGNPDLIRHGENGWMYPPNAIEKLAELLRNIHQEPEKAAAIAKQAKLTSLQEFSLENTLEGYEKLFLHLIQPPA